VGPFLSMVVRKNGIVDGFRESANQNGSLATNFNNEGALIAALPRFGQSDSASC